MTIKKGQTSSKMIIMAKNSVKLLFLKYSSKIVNAGWLLQVQKAGLLTWPPRKAEKVRSNDWLTWYYRKRHFLWIFYTWCSTPAVLSLHTSVSNASLSLLPLFERPVQVFLKYIHAILLQVFLTLFSCKFCGRFKQF